jgi:hypothetical protein
MFGNYLSARPSSDGVLSKGLTMKRNNTFCNKPQIKPNLYNHSGYTIIEALIATAMTSIVGLGIWQLVASSCDLTYRSFRFAQPDCDQPSCTEATQGLRCRCDNQHYFIVR